MNLNMADGGKPKTTAEHFKYDEEKALPVPEFFKNYKDRFPMLAIIVDGIYGLTRFDSYDCYQVIRIHCYTAQPRIICMTEHDATKGNYRYITFPVRTGLLYRVIQSRKSQSQPMTIDEILKKFALPLLVKMEPSEKQRKVKVGNSQYSAQDFGHFLLISQYEETYLKQNCIDGEDLKMNSTACMLSMNGENTVAPITGFKHRSREEFDCYLKKLDKQALEHPDQYNRKDGDPNFAEHNISERAYRNGTASIPLTMGPADAQKIIRTFHNEALPPLPPLLSGEISKSPVLPPRRPAPLHSSASTGSASPKQKALEDEDDTTDYEIPVDYRQESPKLPPRSFKKEPSGFMTELKLKVARDAKTNDKPGESGPKPPERPAMKPPDVLRALQQESNRKNGYENTKIERAVVRPQQIVTQENEYELGDDIYSVPEAEPDGSKEIDSSGSPHKLQEDTDYVDVREVQLPPDVIRDQSHKSHKQPTAIRAPAEQPRTRINPVAEQSDTRSPSTGRINENEERFTGVGHMTIAEVAIVLEKLNLGHYKATFQENCVDGEILSALTVEDFVNELKMRRLEAVRLDRYAKHGHIPQ